MSYDPNFMDYVGFQLYGGGTDPAYDSFRNKGWLFDNYDDYGIPSVEDILRKDAQVQALADKIKKVLVVVIHYDAGYGNQLYIRGNTSPLSWSSGKKCKNIDANTWMFQLETTYETNIEFKILLNDSTWETGYNHSARTGNVVEIYPSF